VLIVGELIPKLLHEEFPPRSIETNGGIIASTDLASQDLKWLISLENSQRGEWCWPWSFN